MRKALLAASALTLALSGAAWAQTSTPSASSTGLHAPSDKALTEPSSKRGPDANAGTSTPAAGTTGGPVTSRATGGTGANAAAGTSTPAAGTTGSAVPVRTQGSNLPPIAADLPQNEYVMRMGEHLREWFPVVDTYLDAGVPQGRIQEQTKVKEAWQQVRDEWDQLQKADTGAWSSARTEFESAYTRFEQAWNHAQRNS